MVTHLDWEGTWNARDLGGIPARSGRAIRPAALVRSESLHRMTDQGWRALRAHGVRTIVDLRNADQRAGEPDHPPTGVVQVPVPIEEGLDADPEFAGWASEGLLSTPLYYERFIHRWPERVGSAVAAVAGAEPGGVLVHCGKGSDRTGLVVLVVLALVGAPADEIAADHALTAVRLSGAAAQRLGARDDAAEITAVLDRARTTPERAILETVCSLELAGMARGAGLDAADLHALRSRLLGLR